MATTRKVYIKSGDFKWVGVVDTNKNPVEVCATVLTNSKKKGILDGDYFYLDERGFREGSKAQWKVSVDKVLKAAGYIYDEPDADDD